MAILLSNWLLEKRECESKQVCDTTKVEFAVVHEIKFCLETSSVHADKPHLIVLRKKLRYVAIASTDATSKVGIAIHVAYHYQLFRV